ncbi:hypothetical protein OG310_01640 [Streptomyces sp. NBC_01497]
MENAQFDTHPAQAQQDAAGEGGEDDRAAPPLFGPFDDSDQQ